MIVITMTLRRWRLLLGGFHDDDLDDDDDTKDCHHDDDIDRSDWACGDDNCLSY